MSNESILEEAQRLIHGPRNKNYGHPRENFADISALFSAYLERPITDLDVANLMILVKVARVKGTGYHRDSYTDIAGYAGCAERIYEEDPRVEITIDTDNGVSSDWLFADEEDNEDSDSLSWVDALNDITYSDGEDEDALVDLDEPRVWNDIRHVPDGVDLLVDRFGNRHSPLFALSLFRAELVNEWAPFTEVVE
ncbi:hypothetical protein SEA_OOGWAY_52 [Mycobacterium phage Oogway]|nr:hypothetical protein SEA_OOGWAY_52 [Mycobacterium phage Oogway]